MDEDDYSSLFEFCKKSISSGTELYKIMWRLCHEFKLSPGQAMFLVEAVTKHTTEA